MANEAIEVLIGLRVRHREGGREGEANGRAGAGERADFRRTISPARFADARGQPRLKPHGVRAIVERLWAGYGGLPAAICPNLH